MRCDSKNEIKSYFFFQKLLNKIYSVIGADIIDSTSNLINHQAINMSSTWFELSPKQNEFQNLAAETSNNIRNNYHALHSALWLTKNKLPAKMIDR